MLPLLAACSGLKLDKESNCLNEKAACYKQDKTRPRVINFTTQPPLDGANSLSELQHIDVTFSEEIKNGELASTYRFKPSAGHSFNVISVQRLSTYTYRLIVGGSLQNTGLIELDITPLKDYNENPMDTVVPVEFTGNVNIPIISSVNHNGVSTTGGYASVNLKFYHNYTADVTNANSYQVRLTSGAVDCSGGTLLTSGSNLAPGPANEITWNVPAASFSSGMNRLVVCISNANNPNAANSASWPIIRDDLAPVLTYTPAGGSYKDPQAITLTCSNNADKIAYTSTTQQGSVPADPAAPTFDPATGNIVTGTPYGTGLTADNPANPTYTKFIWRCIDIAGNLSTALVTPVQFYIDNTIPGVTVNLASGYRQYVSTVNPTSTLAFTTDQVNKTYNIRRNGTNCDGGGDGTLLETGSTPATAGQTISVPLDITTHFTATNTTYPLRICVAGTGIQWGMAYLEVTRDDTVPTIAPTVVSGSYGALQSVEFTCDDAFGSVHRVAYNMTEADGLTVPPAPATPAFNTATGAISSGSEQSGPLSPGDRKTTRYAFRCIDRAGNVSAAGSAQYTIDATLPIVTFVSLNRGAVSGIGGAFNDTTLTFTSNRADLTYRIRRVANCDHSGTPAETIATGTVPAVNSNVPVLLNYASFPTNGQTYALRACVYNLLGASSHQTASVQVVRDDTPPTYGGLTSLSSPATGQFTLNWSAATDGAGSGIAAYNIYRSESASGPWTTIHHVAAHPTTSITVSVPDPLVTYYYVAGAVDNAGNETKVTVAPLVTKPEVRYVVTGLDTANSKTFVLEDGFGGTANVSTNPVAPGLLFPTSLSLGQTYNFRISTQPAGQVCAIREKQFGTLDASITFNISCADGQMVAGRFQVLQPVAMNQMLYRSFATAHASSYAGNSIGNANSVALAGGNVYFGSDADCPNGGPVGYCLYSVPVIGGAVSAVVSNFTYPIRGVASDGSNIYFTTIAPDSRLYKYPISGGSPIEVVSGLNNPFGIAVEDRYVYVAQKGANAIARVDVATGSVTQLVTGLAGGALAVTIVGSDLYFTVDTQHAIYRVPKTGGTASVVYGNASAAGFQDNTGTAARFNAPHDLTYDGAANLFVVEYGGHRLRRVRLSTGRVTTLAGDGVDGLFQNGTGPATRISRPVGVATDGRYIFLSLHGTDKRIVKVTESGLKGHWPLAGNAVDYASDIGTPQSGTVYGSPLTNAVDRYGNSGAYAFDGVDDFISAGGTNLPTGNSARSLCAWVSIPDTTNAPNDGIVTYGVRNLNTVFGLRLGDSVRMVSWDANGDLEFARETEIGKWTHACTTHDGTTTRVFFNGHLMGQAGKSHITSAGALCIGQRSNDLGSSACDGGGFFFKGSIADVRVYSRALSEGEINELAQDASSAQVGSSYNQGATELLAHYEFKGGAPEAANLAASGPVGGTLVGSASSPTGKDGDSSGAAYFGGSAGLSLSATGLPLGNAPRTVCAFYRPQAFPLDDIDYLFSYGANGPNKQFGIGIANLAGVDYIDNIFNSASIPEDHVHARRSNLNTWQHLCAVYDGTDSLLYYNGQLMSTQARALDTVPNDARIGSIYSGGQYFSGDIDDVRIYNKALSAFEVRQIAVQVPAGLVAHYDFTNDRNDVSGFGQNLSNNGANLGDDRFGVANNAATFGGADYFETTMNGLPTGNAARTVCAWARPTALTAGFSRLAMYGTATLTGAFGLGVNNARYFSLNGAANLIFLQAPPLNTWRHLCVTFTGSPGDFERLYLDGNSVASQAVALSTGTGGVLRIGRALDVTDFFTGSLDDVRIYNRALDTNEIQALVTQPNKRMQLSGSTVPGDMGGSNPGIGGADQLCPSGYKAMLVDGINRRACTTANCVTSGLEENIDWVLRPNITYVTNPARLPIFTADWNSVWNFAGTAPTGGNLIYQISISSYEVWTGLTANWLVANFDCGDWFGGYNGAYGISDATTGALNNNGTALCAESKYLYCVEQ